MTRKKEAKSKRTSGHVERDEFQACTKKLACVSLPIPAFTLMHMRAQRQKKSSTYVASKTLPCPSAKRASPSSHFGLLTGFWSSVACNVARRWPVSPMTVKQSPTSSTSTPSNSRPMDGSERVGRMYIYVYMRLGGCDGDAVELGRCDGWKEAAFALLDLESRDGVCAAVAWSRSLSPH